MNTRIHHRTGWRIAALLVAALCSVAATAAPAPILRLETGTHGAAVRALAVDAKERLLLTVSDDKTARLWSAADGQALAVLRPPIGPGAEGRLFAGALSPDGNVAAVGGYSAQNDVYLFDTRNAAMKLRLSGHGNVINALAFSADGQHLAVCLWGRSGLVIYHSKDHWQTAQWAASDTDYGGDCYGLDFAPDGGTLATSSVDGEIRLYARRGKAWPLTTQRTLPGAGRPFGLRFAPDGLRLAVGYEDRARVEVLDARQLQTVASPVVAGINEGNFAALAWSREGKYLYAAGTARSAASKHLLRRWPSDDFAKHRDSLIASDTVTAMIARRDGGLWFAAASATWGHVDEAGAAAQRVLPPIADFRASRADFGLDQQGRELSFAFEFGGKERARFDLQHLVLLTAGHAPPPRVAPLRKLTNWQDSPRPLLDGQPLKLELGEIALSAAEDARQRVALGSNFQVRLHDAAGKLLWHTTVSSPCFALAFSADGRWVVGGFGDGTLRWFETARGQEKLALFVHADRKRWVLWSPEGRFAASEDGASLVGWHLNRGPDQAADFLPFERFHAKHFDPAGLAGILAGEAPRRPVADLRQGLKLPPVVKLLSPREGERLTRSPVRVEVAVEDRGGGVEELRLFHNGKRLALPATRDALAKARPGATRNLSFEVALEKGANELRVVALAKDQTESTAQAVKVKLEGSSAPARLHVFVVGINRYKNAALNLDYSVPDARSVAQFFRGKPNTLFESTELAELYDAQATKAGLLQGLGRLQGVRPEDVVVVYLAGHGEAVGEEWYFIPHDAVHPERPEALKREGLSSRELAQAVTALPARKVVVMIDACKSGAALSGFRGLEERRALAQLSRATGTHLVAATTKDQLASEVQALGHGVFTFTLLEGLKGKAALGGRDVTARKLISFVEQALPELSLRHRAEEQYPVAISRGMDFPMVLP